MMRWGAGLAIALVACSGPPPKAGPDHSPTGRGDSAGSDVAGDGNDGTSADAADAVEFDLSGGPPWATADAPEDLPSTEWISVVAAGRDESIARGAAEVELRALLWGDDERPPVAPPAPFDSASDVMRVAPLGEAPENGVVVLLAVNRTALAERLRGWMADAPAVEVTDASTPAGQLAGVMAFLHFQQMQRWGCRRLTAVLGAECEEPSLRVAQNQLRSIAQRLTLEPVYEGGIPAREGRPLRPAAVHAVWTSNGGERVPWAGLPLIFERPADVPETAGMPPSGATGDAEGSVSATEPPPSAGAVGTGGEDADATVDVTEVLTDERGYAEKTLDGLVDPAVRVTVRVDPERLLGRDADLWPKGGTVELSLRPIPARSHRIGVALRESIMGREHAAGSASTAAAKALAQLGYVDAHRMAPETVGGLSEASGETFAEAVRRVADVARGRVDVLAYGDVRSEFASRMGARSVWHEASGTVRLYDAWTGRSLGVIEEATRAAGIGDRDAGGKALRALGQAIGERAHALLAPDPSS